MLSLNLILLDLDLIVFVIQQCVQLLLPNVCEALGLIIFWFDNGILSQLSCHLLHTLVKALYARKLWQNLLSTLLCNDVRELAGIIYL